MKPPRPSADDPTRTPDEQEPDTVEVLAIGPRGGHAAYQAATGRVGTE